MVLISDWSLYLTGLYIGWSYMQNITREHNLSKSLLFQLIMGYGEKHRRQTPLQM